MAKSGQVAEANAAARAVAAAVGDPGTIGRRAATARSGTTKAIYF